MLPIRLGTVNSDGPQELFIYTITRKGRVETTNYRTVPLPTGGEIPPYVKEEFGSFYKAMFAQQVKREDMRAVFLEYAWDMNWCDPCAADPLSQEELRKLGVPWLSESPQPISGPGGLIRRPPPPGGAPAPMPPPMQGTNAFITRLHVRYDAEHFPEDLVFQETPNRENFQGRYVLRHAWDGTASCSAADEYRRQLPSRREREAQTLATLTGWDINAIRRKVGGTTKISDEAPLTAPARSWWERLFR
jgi:hypothetical protein